MAENELVPLNAAEVMLSADLTRARFAPIMKTQHALDIRAAVRDAFANLMNEGEDYGKVAGIGKPTLLQPGAQKLDNLFGLVPRFPMEMMRIEEDWTGERHGGEPFFRYMVVCQLMRDGYVMGECIGECNSWESKYRYRSADRLCPDCGKASIIQTKHKSGAEEGKPKNFWCAPFKGGCGHGFKLDDSAITKQETGKRPNPDICDQVNTLLKMAQKRAHVGATINATSASEFFTQDMDERQESSEHAPVAEQAPKPAPPEPFKMDFNTLGYFGTVKGEMKKLLDDDDMKYYAILAAHGYEHSKDIRTRDEAERIYKELKQVVKDELARVTA